MLLLAGGADNGTVVAARYCAFELAVRLYLPTPCIPKAWWQTGDADDVSALSASAVWRMTLAL